MTKLDPPSMEKVQDDLKAFCGKGLVIREYPDEKTQRAWGKLLFRIGKWINMRRRSK